MSASGSLLEVPEKSASFEMLINSIMKSGHPLVGDLIQNNSENITKLSPSIPCSFAYDIAGVVLSKEQKSQQLQIQSFESFCTVLSASVEKILKDKPAKPPAVLSSPASGKGGDFWDINLFKGGQEAKDVVKKQMNRLDRLMPTSQEHAQISDWLDLVFSIPINTESKDNTNIEEVRALLDHSHYGLEEVKQEILEHVVVRQHAPLAPEKIMLFDGPPGTGKTIMAEAIAKSLGRKLIKISMGSITEPSQIVGDRRVYLGSSIGKLIHSLIRAKTDKLVILLDEIDKIGRSHKGDPTAVLLDALDPNQNHSFVDNYLGFPVNLRNVMFICTSNDWSKIPKPLYDRMNTFVFKDYSLESKRIIAAKYILPKLCDVYNFQINLTKESNYLLCKNVNLREIEQRLCKIISHYIFQSRIFDKHPPSELSCKDVDSIINKNTKTKRVGF
jgi:ATP-dependent Lon protease